MRALLHAALFRLGAFDTAARGESLVAEYAQGLDLGPLAVARTVFQYLDVARAWHPVRVFLFFLFGQRPPQHQQFANVLDRRGIKIVGQSLENLFTDGPVVRLYPHFDESVRVERCVDFLFDGSSQAGGANHHHRVEVVCFGAVILVLGGSKLYLSHTSIIAGAHGRTIASMKVSQKIVTAEGAGASQKGKKLNKAWLHEHINDPYVKLAQKDGYRARAAYKLKEIDETLGLIRPGDRVVDLGSTPGAWSQYVRRKLSPDGAAAGALNGSIIGLDLLPMEPIEGVVFIQGDFREPEVLRKLEHALSADKGHCRVDLVISDMAPNLSGIESADAARIAHLVELAVDFAQNHLKQDGVLVAKLFHGSSYDELVKLFRATFKTVKSMKPMASRSNSSETFLIGRDLKSRADTGR